MENKYTIHDEKISSLSEQKTKHSILGTTALGRLDSNNEIEFTPEIIYDDYGKRPVTIGELFSTYHSYEKDEMECMKKEDLMKCLNSIGINIQEKSVEDEVWKLFDLDNAGEITLTDFQATLSAFISGNDVETSSVLFKIFDKNNDTYLTVDDLSQLLYVQNQIAILITQSSPNQSSVKTFSKEETNHRAKSIMSSYLLNNDKMSFSQFKLLLGDRRISRMVVSNKDSTILSQMSAEN